MKAGLFAAAAGSLLASAYAADHHGHQRFHKRGGASAQSCGCTTYTTYFYAEQTGTYPEFVPRDLRTQQSKTGAMARR